MLKIILEKKFGKIKVEIVTVFCMVYQGFTLNRNQYNSVHTSSRSTEKNSWSQNMTKTMVWTDKWIPVWTEIE